MVLRNRRYLVYGLTFVFLTVVFAINQNVLAEQKAPANGVIFTQMPAEAKDNYAYHVRISIDNASDHIYQFYHTRYDVGHGYSLAYLPPNGTIILPGKRFIAGIEGLVKPYGILPDNEYDTEQFWLRDLSSSRIIHLVAKFDLHKGGLASASDASIIFSSTKAASTAQSGNSRFIGAPLVKYINGTKNGHSYPGSTGTFFNNGDSYLSSNYLQISEPNNPVNDKVLEQPPTLHAHPFFYCNQTGCHSAYRVKVVSGALNADIDYKDTHKDVNLDHYSVAMLPYHATLVDPSTGHQQNWLVPLAPGLMIQKSNDNVSLSTPSEFVITPSVGASGSSSMASDQLTVLQQLDSQDVDDMPARYTMGSERSSLGRVSSTTAQATGAVETSGAVPLSFITDTPAHEDVSHLYMLILSNTKQVLDNGQQEGKLGVVICRVPPINGDGACADPVPQDSPLYNDIYFTYDYITQQPNSFNDVSDALVTNDYQVGGSANKVLVESASSSMDDLAKRYAIQGPWLYSDGNTVTAAKPYYLSILPDDSLPASLDAFYEVHANLCEPGADGKVRCANNASYASIDVSPTTANGKAVFTNVPVSDADKANVVAFNQPLTCSSTVKTSLYTGDYLPTYRYNKANSVVGTIRGIINYFDPTSANGTLTCDPANNKHLVRVDNNVDSIYRGDIRAVDQTGSYYRSVLYPKK